jgi:sugar phosphate isomerase/epimerase
MPVHRVTKEGDFPLLRPKLAVQMFTLRDFTGSAAVLADAFARIRAIGYEAVQLSAIACMNGPAPEVNAALARQLLDDNGLKCIATHRGWDSLAGETEREIDFHHTLGCHFAAIGGIPGPYGARGAEGYRQFVGDAAQVIARLKAAGIGFGHHNHAHEFERVAPGSPKTLWDILIDKGGPDYLLEADLYWIWHAGADPVQVLGRSAGRVPVIHLKDREVVEKDGPVMAPIGEGNLPWNTILPACEAAGVQWYAVEQDTCRRDPFDCLRSSFEYLSTQTV